MTCCILSFYHRKIIHLLTTARKPLPLTLLTIASIVLQFWCPCFLPSAFSLLFFLLQIKPSKPSFWMFSTHCFHLLTLVLNLGFPKFPSLADPSLHLLQSFPKTHMSKALPWLSSLDSLLLSRAIFSPAAFSLCSPFVKCKPTDKEYTAFFIWQIVSCITRSEKSSTLTNRFHPALESSSEKLSDHANATSQLRWVLKPHLKSKESHQTFCHSYPRPGHMLVNQFSYFQRRCSRLPF